MVVVWSRCVLPGLWLHEGILCLTITTLPSLLRQLRVDAIVGGSGHRGWGSGCHCNAEGAANGGAAMQSVVATQVVLHTWTFTAALASSTAGGVGAVVVPLSLDHRTRWRLHASNFQIQSMLEQCCWWQHPRAMHTTRAAGTCTAWAKPIRTGASIWDAVELEPVRDAVDCVRAARSPRIATLDIRIRIATL